MRLHVTLLLQVTLTLKFTCVVLAFPNPTAYGKSVITHKVTLYFERDDIDVKLMSQADLRVLEPLPHLAGTWDITQFADSEYLLQYGGVTVVGQAE